MLETSTVGRPWLTGTLCPHLPQVQPPVSSLLSFAAMEGAGRLPSRSRMARFGALVLGVVSALVIARPLGLTVQREVTTSSDMDGVRIADVTGDFAGDVPVHRVHLTFDQ